jgi:maltooligosyltrehalose trehalohydrolase
MKRRHSMPFGAECQDDGSVRFRLWAPAASQIDLCLEDSVTLPLERRDQGWFELVTDAAGPGSRYKFRVFSSQIGNAQIGNSQIAQEVPDPVSRFQPQDVHGPSEVINSDAFDWQDSAWRGRRWEEAVLYELHVGAFTPSGTFSGVAERLDYLADLGITALELMPVADFPGRRNWGYDGVFPFAPDSSYGRPDDLKQLVQSAHARGMMILLDVVYNHFGPEGNYLNSYAPQFFTDRHCTPWGNGINFDGPENRVVRDFFIHNALYWLTEYHFDGLRLDAVHAIVDDSQPHILTELADAVHKAISPDRQVHLILENERNQASFLYRTTHCRPREYTAQWNDDIHHALHVLLTGESDGYYSDYSQHPVAQVGRCLTEGFAYQGEISDYAGKARGEPSADLPPAAFVSFLQNHDHIGNRAFGERIIRLAEQPALRAAMAILLLAPSPPMLFMGEEFGAETPFLFFCDFENDLAAVVTAGRRNEFARFAKFNDPIKREQIPDPNAATTFEDSRLNWQAMAQPRSQGWLRFYRELLQLRCQHIVPRLSSGCPSKANFELRDDHVLSAHWLFPDRRKLSLLANLGAEATTSLIPSDSNIIYSYGGEGYTSEEASDRALGQARMPGWSVVWFLES